MEERIVYFEKAGEENTSEVLRLARERASAWGIDKVVLASTTGNTARSAMEAFANTNIKLVVVPWQFGFAEMLGMGEGQRFPRELVAELERSLYRVWDHYVSHHRVDVAKRPKIKATQQVLVAQSMPEHTTYQACRALPASSLGTSRKP